MQVQLLFIFSPFLQIFLSFLSYFLSTSWTSSSRLKISFSWYGAQLIHFHSYSYLIKILPFAVSVLNTALFLSEHNYGWLIRLAVHSRLLLEAIFPVVCFVHSTLCKAGVVQNIFGIPTLLLLKCHQSLGNMALMKKYIEIRERM